MTPQNLPTRGKLTPREEPLLLEIRQALLNPEVPIVTLLGPAGAGKTALAVEVAHRLLEEGSFPGGIVWLDCGYLPTLDAMAETVRSTFGLPRSATVQQDVNAYLRSRSCLLILDAYDAVAQDMGLLAFLDQLPRPSKALVTSRERVGLLAQERILRVQPAAEGPVGLELRIRPGTSGRYQVFVEGEVSHTLDIAAIQLTEERHHRELRRDTRRYGRRLFQSLFAKGSIARQALARLPQASDGAGVLLIATEAPEAQMVPWEYLHDGNDFLALKYHVVRGVPSERRQGYGAEMPAAALDLIIVPSDPLLLNGSAVDQLEIAKEVDALKTALQGAEAPYRALIITPPTLDALHEALAHLGRRTIVHFIGHGLATPEGAILLFEDETGLGRAISARDFAHRVRGYAFLVLLNACQSATSLSTSVSNLAYTLATEGLPYALGMQFSVPDAAALKLARFFYRFLAEGHSVEEAVRQARIALAASDDLPGLKDYAMGIPVLYTSFVRGFARFRVEPGTMEIREATVRQEFDTEISEAAIFRGRRQELAAIGQRLQDGAKVLTLVGPGGSGKSALARKAASRFAWRFSDGILGLSLEHLPAKEEIIIRLAHWLLGPDADTLAPDKREREVIAAFKASSMLLVLDNYETLLAGREASAPDVNKQARALGQFLRRLVGGKVTLLVTTRDRPTDLPGEGRPLEVLDLDLLAALQLFRDHAGERWQETDERLLTSLKKLTQEGQSLDELPRTLEAQPLLQLIRSTGLHALAIELLARAYAEGDESIADLAAGWQDRLREARDRYRDSDERHVTLAACFGYSYRTLPPAAQDLLPKLTVFTAPFLADIVEAVLSLPEAGELLNLLFRKSILQRQEVTEGLSFYFFHPMARWYAEERAEGVDWASLRQALGRVYLNFARSIYGKLNHSTSLAARVMLPDLREAVNVLPNQERSLLAFHLAWLFQIFGDLTRAMELYQESLDINEQLGDLRGKGATLAMRGQLLAAAGERELALQDFVEALVTLADIGAQDAEQVVGIIRGLKADVGVEEFNGLWRKVTGQEEVPEWLAEPQKTDIDRLLTLAATQEEQKEWRPASETYSEVLSLLRSRTLSHDEQRRQAEAVLRLGVCLRQDGQWGSAVERLQEAFRLFKGLKDFHGQGLAYLEIARAYQAMNSYDLAMLYYKDASRLFKRAGNAAMDAAAHEEAGNLQVYLRAFPGAIVDLEEAARLYREANIPSRAAIVDQNLELARQSHE
jgi:tetratricopeptide (TPR) repeat protein/ABC-type uncharacterized transport system YnjBCD ATPase subunit